MISKHAGAAILLLSFSVFMILLETTQINKFLSGWSIHKSKMILSTIPFEYIGRQDIKSEQPLEKNHRTIDRDEKRSSQHSDNTHETTISFDGATFFISILRYAHYSKTSQRMPNNTVPGCNPEELRTKNLHAIHRAIEVDWIGRNLSSVMKSSAGSGRMSCNFVAAEFPPTEMTLQTQLKGRVYNTVFHTAGQCANSFQWDKDKVRRGIIIISNRIYTFLSVPQFFTKIYFVHANSRYLAEESKINGVSIIVFSQYSKTLHMICEFVYVPATSAERLAQEQKMIASQDPWALYLLETG